MTHKFRGIVVLLVILLSGIIPGAFGTVSAAVGSTSIKGQPLQTVDYVTVGKVKRASAPVHIRAYSSSARVATLKRGEEYPILRSAKYHYQIALLGGKKGWIRKSHTTVRKAPRFVVGWNYGGGTEQFKRVSDYAALDVVSPKWYGLHKDSIVTLSPDPNYVEWAHARGKKVWAMLGNGFQTELTDEILSSTDKRTELVRKVADSLKTHGIDGINVDFENMKIENREEFTALIRELRTAVSPHGILVSVDVTRENPDPFWSGCYDREALGREADFIVMMGYDEYYTGRGQAGSVASMPWVEEGLDKLLAVVPAHKVILGVPFYTREWTEPAGGGRAVSKDMTMAAVEKRIADKGLTKSWDEKAGQHYVEYSDSAGRHRLWVEDVTSMKTRWSMVRARSLGGAAAWAVGQETPDIWGVFK